MNVRYLNHCVVLFYPPYFMYFVFGNREVATNRVTKVYCHSYYIWCSAIPGVWCLFCPSYLNYGFGITLIQHEKAFQAVVENKDVLVYYSTHVIVTKKNTEKIIIKFKVNMIQSYVCAINVSVHWKKYWYPNENTWLTSCVKILREKTF